MLTAQPSARRTTRNLPTPLTISSTTSPRARLAADHQAGQVEGDGGARFAHIAAGEARDLVQSVDDRVAVDLQPLGRGHQVGAAFAPGDQCRAQYGKVVL